jgi:hypothetical protein
MEASILMIWLISQDIFCNGYQRVFRVSKVECGPAKVSFGGLEDCLDDFV